MTIMKKLMFLTLTTLLLVSCSNDDDNSGDPVTPAGAYEKGILITNEGPFGNGSGTVSFISEDYSVLENNIFKTVNNSDLGNIVQSMGFLDEKAYIVVNNSQKIEIANRYTFERIDTIANGLNNPRYFVAKDGARAYVSNWGDPNDNTDDFIAVINLVNNSVSTTIPVDFGAERMVYNNNKLYVAHQGGYGQNNLISVISTSNNTVEKTITVGDVPNSMVIADDMLYVLCGGNPDYTGNETAGSMVTIDLANDEVVETNTLGDTQHPSSLTIDGTNLYYSLDGSVYETNTVTTTLPGTSVINGFFYTIEAHNGMLYATDAGDYASDGTLKVYDLSTNQMTQDFTVGIIPGGIYFND